ncbi:MAG: heme exporter protein CcmB [Blastocatellia bacterium]|nr:heme exporter protein CcmB [Blastocatellia bacterium]MCS7157424.1 heme exporter protein CcmB [Blastocatellia bacterium]MCX7752598.1 heme exporter protein CcmB [Blastocatellia bacterium]MDW8168329.1 heme exporter protein CcmB [Acidobacteriota bacterium]MDW8255525.1 heme exporter protein CcmB [Acidobacteriota bacterium]
MSYWTAATRIVAKDLLSEARTREMTNAMLFFALLVLVLFSFSFQPASDEERRLAAGVLWIAFLFAGLSVLDRSFLRERVNDCLDALRLTPASASALFVGKCVANALFLLLAEVILVPLFLIFFDLSFRGDVGTWLLALMLGTWALVVNGTFFAAMTTNVRSRELLLPLLLLPISVPALIAVVEATSAALLGEGAMGVWIQVLIAFDVIYTTLAMLLFETVLEGA